MDPEEAEALALLRKAEQHLGETKAEVDGNKEGDTKEAETKEADMEIDD